MSRHVFEFELTQPLDEPPSYIEVQGACRLPGEWFPCEQPEQAFDHLVALHDCCPPCLIAARAAVQRGDDLTSDVGAVLPLMEQRLATYGPARRLEGRQ